MAGYIGTIPVPQATQTRETFTATANQTNFATGGYTPNFIDVFMNGAKLAPADFTATNGSDVVLASGAAANDIIDIVAFTAFQVLNQNFTGNTTTQDLTVSGNLTVTGSTITIDTATVQNVDLGDNDKIRLGDGDDLQIYAASGVSFIKESGSGNLNVNAANFILNNADDSQNMFKAKAGAEVELYFNNSQKLETTSTGVDVTGTVTADGLTVESNSQSTGAIATLRNTNISTDGNTVIGALVFDNSDNSANTTDAEIRAMSDSSAGRTDLYLRTGNAGTLLDRLKVRFNGDISFYDDGGNAKLFWDASAERLGIGTDSPGFIISTKETNSVTSLNVNDGPAFSRINSSGNGQMNFLSLNVTGNGGSQNAWGGMGLVQPTASSNNADLFFFTRGSSIAERMRIDSDGKVGIGTSSPSQLLHIAGDGNIAIKLDSTSTGGDSWRIFSNDNTSSQGGGSMAFYNEDTATYALNLQSSGNVGIGTTSPDTKLHIEGGSLLVDAYGVGVDAGIFLREGFLTINQPSITVWDKDNGGVSPDGISINGNDGIRFRENGGEVARFDDGNLLLGGTSNFTGTYRAVFQDTSSEILALNATSSTLSQLAFGNTSMSGFGQTKLIANGTSLAFVTSSAERMRLDASGNLLVGKTSFGLANVGVTLLPNGIYSTSTGVPMYLNRNGSSGTILEFRTNNSTSGYIYSTTGSVSYNTSSDYRLKENVTDVTDGITRLKQLAPKRFNFIADADRIVDGFLAHEAATVVPEAVTGEKDAMKDEEYEVKAAVTDDDGNVVEEAVMGTRSVPDYQGIDQAKIVPLLTAALKEAIAKIETLETKVTALEG